MKVSEPKQEMIDGMPKYEVESCMDCLIRAEEIKRDPKKMKAIMKLVGIRKKAISSLAELKAKAEEVPEEEEEDDE